MMGMENFGINVDVNVDTEVAQKNLGELLENLTKLKETGSRGINLDLGLSKLKEGTINDLIRLVTTMSSSNGFAKAFEISDASVTSLEQLRKTAEQISKLTKGQTSLIKTDGMTKGVKETNVDLKFLENQIKSLQKQMAKTKDGRVFGDLGDQLKEYRRQYTMLTKQMGDDAKDNGLGKNSKRDKQYLNELERIYANTFEGIQNKARAMQKSLSDVSSNKNIDVNAYKQIEKELTKISNLKFDGKNINFHKTLSESLLKTEELKRSISDLSKSANVGGLNQSNNMTKWKQINEQINNLKKSMATLNSNDAFNAQRNQIQSLNKELKETYNAMTEVDKQATVAFKKTSNDKMDSYFTKQADKLLKQSQTLKQTIKELNGKDLMDTNSLDKFKSKIDGISNGLKSALKNNSLNEYNLSSAAKGIDLIKSSVSELGVEAQKSLKINDFTKGMEAQLTSLKAKYKDALPQQEIYLIRERLKELNNVATDSLSGAFKEINNDVQKLSGNAKQVTSETQKALSTYNQISASLGNATQKYDALVKAGALNTQQAKQYKDAITSVSKTLNNANTNNNLKKLDLTSIFTDVKNLNKELKDIKMPDFVGQWKKTNDQIVAIKKTMTSLNSENAFDSQKEKVQSLNRELNKLYKKMSESEQKLVDSIKVDSGLNLNNSYVKQADKLISQIQTLKNTTKGLKLVEGADQDALTGYINKLDGLNRSMKNALNKDTLNESKLYKTVNEIEKLKISLSGMGDAAKKSLKISDFTKGMESQLASMKAKYKGALPDEEIARILEMTKQLNSVPMDKLQSEFKNINNEVQKLRAGADDVTKTFSKVDKLTAVYNELSSVYSELTNKQMLFGSKAEELGARINVIADAVNNAFNTKSLDNLNFSKITKDANAIKKELNSIKSVDLVTQWKEYNSQLTTAKQNLTKSYSSDAMNKYKNEINQTEAAMGTLVAQMNEMEQAQVRTFSNKSSASLGTFFTKQADSVVKDIDKVIKKFDELSKKDFVDGDSVEGALNQLLKLKNEMNSGLSGKSILDENSINAVKQSLNGIVTVYDKIDSESKQAANAMSGVGKEYMDLHKQMKEAQKGAGMSKTPEAFKEWSKQIDEIQLKMNKLYSGMNSSQKGIADDLNTKLKGNLFTSDLDKMLSQANKMKDTLAGFGSNKIFDTAKLDGYSRSLEKMMTTMKNGLANGMDGKEFNSLFNNLNKLQAEFSELSRIENFSSKIDAELDRIEASCNSPAIKKGIEDIRRSLVELGNTPIGSNGIDKQMTNIEGSLRRVQSSARRTGTFFSDLYGSMRTFTLGNMIGDQITRGMRESVKAVRELDKALVEVQRVAPMDFSRSADSLKGLKNEAIAVAKEVGQSSNDVLVGVSEALKAGAKDMESAMAIAKQSAIFANVADLDQREASQSINGILAAFGGISNALKPVRGEIQGTTEDYSNLQHATDLMNHAG